MTPIHSSIALLLLSSFATAQVPTEKISDILFTLTKPEQTRSGAGGTSLGRCQPNEILHLPALTFCSAEKWGPLAMSEVHAGDENFDDQYYNPNLFGNIDALTRDVFFSGGTLSGTNQRTVFFSPAVDMGTAVSGAPGLRAGDVGRIVKAGGLDGQVEHFLTAEQVQVALGLPPTPVFVNVDAIAYQPNFGVLFSLEEDTSAFLCVGPPIVRDGDVLMIPANGVSWSSNGTVGAVLPGSAVVAHSEAAMDAFVINAQVSDRNGACVQHILDTDALEIDLMQPVSTWVASCGGSVPVPKILFAGESLTGGAVLDTGMGGRIRPSLCGGFGTPCGLGPTLGDQVGMMPLSVTQGIASSVNGLTGSRVCTFVSDTFAPQIAVSDVAKIDFQSPGGITWVFASFAPPGPGAVPVSAPFPWAAFCYPDYYPTTFFMGSIATAPYGTYVSPPIPFATDLTFMGVTIAGGIEISTPTIVEVF